MFSRFEQFSSVISGINRYIQMIERDEMEKYGYKGAFAQYLVAFLHCPEGCTAAQLCDICDKDKAAVSRIIGEMEEKGLVIRQGSNERLYNARITLTQEGQKAADFVRRKATAAVNAVGNEMTDENRKAFYNTLEFIAGKLQSISKTGIPEEV